MELVTDYRELGFREYDFVPSSQPTMESQVLENISGAKAFVIVHCSRCIVQKGSLLIDFLKTSAWNVRGKVLPSMSLS